MVNHIDGHNEITRKDKLLENFTYYCEKQNANIFDILPLSYELILDGK